MCWQNCTYSNRYSIIHQSFSSGPKTIENNCSWKILAKSWYIIIKQKECRLDVTGKFNRKQIDTSAKCSSSILFCETQYNYIKLKLFKMILYHTMRELQEKKYTETTQYKYSSPTQHLYWSLKLDLLTYYSRSLTYTCTQ